jgi:hypothetical protein
MVIVFVTAEFVTAEFVSVELWLIRACTSIELSVIVAPVPSLPRCVVPARKF